MKALIKISKMVQLHLRLIKMHGSYRNDDLWVLGNVKRHAFIFKLKYMTPDDNYEAIAN